MHPALCRQELWLQKQHTCVHTNLESVKFSCPSFFFPEGFNFHVLFFYLHVLVGESALTLYVPMLLFVYVLTVAICAESAWLGRGVRKVCSPTLGLVIFPPFLRTPGWFPSNVGYF